MKKIEDCMDKSKEILISTDHGGLEMKNFLAKKLQEAGYKINDIGPKSFDPNDDYCDYASALAKRISLGLNERGILICRSGVGMTINANRFH